MWARKQGGVVPAVESKHMDMGKDMGMSVYEDHELGAFWMAVSSVIVIFCVRVGLVRMRLFWLMAEQTRIAAIGIIGLNRMSDSGSGRRNIEFETTASGGTDSKSFDNDGTAKVVRAIHD